VKEILQSYRNKENGRVIKALTKIFCEGKALEVELTQKEIQELNDKFSGGLLKNKGLIFNCLLKNWNNASASIIIEDPVDDLSQN